MGTPPTPNTTAVRIQSPFSTEIPFRRFMLRLLALRESTRMLHPFLGAPKSLHRRLEVGLGLGLVRRRLRLSPPQRVGEYDFFCKREKMDKSGDFDPWCYRVIGLFHMILNGGFCRKFMLRHSMKSQKVLLGWFFLLNEYWKIIVLLCCLRVGLFGVLSSLFVHEKKLIGERKTWQFCDCDLFGMLK